MALEQSPNFLNRFLQAKISAISSKGKGVVTDPESVIAPNPSINLPGFPTYPAPHDIILELPANLYIPGMCIELEDVRTFATGAKMCSDMDASGILPLFLLNDGSYNNLLAEEFYQRMEIITPSQIRGWIRGKPFTLSPRAIATAIGVQYGGTTSISVAEAESAWEAMRGA